MKYKVGDKVMVTGGLYNPPVGTELTIVRVEDLGAFLTYWWRDETDGEDGCADFVTANEIKRIESA